MGQYELEVLIDTDEDGVNLNRIVDLISTIKGVKSITSVRTTIDIAKYMDKFSKEQEG